MWGEELVCIVVVGGRLDGEDGFEFGNNLSTNKIYSYALNFHYLIVLCTLHTRLFHSHDFCSIWFDLVYIAMSSMRNSTKSTNPS